MKDVKPDCTRDIKERTKTWTPLQEWVDALLKQNNRDGMPAAHYNLLHGWKNHWPN